MKKHSSILIILAFLTVYLVWGSTYLFIKIALKYFPPMIMGALRFISAGMILFIWCFFKREYSHSLKIVKTAIINGILLIFISYGTTIWAEQFLPSGFVALLIGASPIWFVVLDYYNWKSNFFNKEVILGIVIGFIGISLLVSENVLQAFSIVGNKSSLLSLGVLIVGSISWCLGSLYSKYKPNSYSNSINVAWQMFIGGLIFLIASVLGKEWTNFHFSTIPIIGWTALLYLIILGSIAAFSAYIWLLQVRPIAQVSTYAYINPVIAVLLGILVAGEKITFIQLLGLVIILVGVFLLNLAKYRNSRFNRSQ